MPVVQQAQGGQIQEIIQRLNAMQEAINNVQATLATMNTRFQHLPMQLANATASMTAPILYPLNGPLPPECPITKLALLSISAPHAQVTAEYLGLPPLQPDAALVDRRRQLIGYLGCVVS
ncbi:hypothetical protein EDB85DRAFT_2140670 [Lactarius pseudohatsudake]|nr:hypothetical protein EDB85DRAFT_2140670 [Lactarius pseudohatsudake]